MFRKLDLFASSDEGRETPTLLGPFERANLNLWTKSTNPVILNVIYHRQNPLDSNLSCFDNHKFTVCVGNSAVQFAYLLLGKATHLPFPLNSFLIQTGRPPYASLWVGSALVEWRTDVCTIYQEIKYTKTFSPLQA
jgi:hypothetical protein